MTVSIEHVAVIGAGTMGAAIAAHAANAGLPVLLLDIAPRELTDDEAKRGLTLDDKAVKNRIVRQGFERIAKIKPASFMGEAARKLVRLGNLDDDLEKLAEADWIVEAVVERLDVKKDLMRRIESVKKPGAVVTTNTSGLPIDRIIADCGDDMKGTFFGTHFFNPPRYMKLLEVIRGSRTDPKSVFALTSFASRHLGKGVVLAKDTPNFIGNRILSIHGTWVMDAALRQGYRFEEVDALTGPLIGRPKTATFRLQDLVGIDISWGVGQNLYDLIPEDPHRGILKSEPLTELVEGLFERGRLGNKTGSGFYRKSKGKGGKPVFEVLDPKTFDYEPQEEVDFACLGVAHTRDLGERVQMIFSERYDSDRGAKLARAAVMHLLSYAAEIGPEIAFDLPSVDKAIRWGFSYEMGPFELWGRLGVAPMAERLKAAGLPLAGWVEEMLDAGVGNFYRHTESGRPTGYYSWSEKEFADLPRNPRRVAVEDLRLADRTVDTNESASLHDLGKGVLLLEFHSKMNAIDDGTVAMMRRAEELLREGDTWQGLVIGNDGTNFCVGANLKNVAEAAAAGRHDEIREAVAALQDALGGLRQAPKPVVAAVHGMALGGGCEIALGVDRIVAAAESYIGLVEVGVGLLPAGGGLKELVRRVITPAMAVKEGDPLPYAQKLLETVAMAKVSTSADEARELGFLASEDRVVMNRDHLLTEARQEVLAMSAAGYVPPAPAALYAGGRDLLAALEIAVWSLAQAGYASPHDALVAKKIAEVLTGGRGSAPEWLGEDHFLKLERDSFVELVATEKTQERIVHMLKTGKPLRN